MRSYSNEEEIDLFLEKYAGKLNPNESKVSKEQVLVGIWYSYHYPFQAAMHKTHRYFLQNYATSVEHSLDRNSNQNFKVWLTDIYHFISNNYFSTINDAASYVIGTGRFDHSVLNAS